MQQQQWWPDPLLLQDKDQAEHRSRNKTWNWDDADVGDDDGGGDDVGDDDDCDVGDNVGDDNENLNTGINSFSANDIMYKNSIQLMTVLVYDTLYVQFYLHKPLRGWARCRQEKWPQKDKMPPPFLPPSLLPS